MILLVTIINVIVTVLAQNNDAWQYSPLIKYAPPQPIEEIEYSYPYLKPNTMGLVQPNGLTATVHDVTTAIPAKQDPYNDHRIVIDGLVQPNGLTATVHDVTTAIPAKQDPYNDHRIVIDNHPNQNTVPPADIKCLNSQILMDVMNKLLLVLEKSIQDGYKNIEKVTTILDDIKQHIDETPNVLDNEEFNARIRNLNNRVDSEFRFAPWNNNNNAYNENVSGFNSSNTPGIETELFKIKMPGLQNPNCREALLKLMQITQNAYRQVANSPMCTNFPATLIPTFQPYKTMDANVQLVKNHDNFNPYQPTISSFAYNKPLSRPNDAYLSNAVPEFIMMADQNNLVKPYLTLPYNKTSRVPIDDMKKYPQDIIQPAQSNNELLTEPQKQYIANLTLNKNMLNNMGYKDDEKNNEKLKSDVQNHLSYGINQNFPINYQLSQSIPFNGQKSISNNANNQNYPLHPSIPIQVTQINPYFNPFGSAYQQLNNPIMPNRNSQVNPSYISDSQHSPNNTQMVNKNLESLNNIYSQIDGYLNPSASNYNVSVNNNNFYHYTERSTQGKTIPNSAIAYALAETGRVLQKPAQNNPMFRQKKYENPTITNGPYNNYFENPNMATQKPDQNPTIINGPYNNYIENPNYVSNSDLIQDYKIQNPKQNNSYAMQNANGNEKYINNVINEHANTKADVTNLNKLNLNADNTGMIELTYMLKRPEPIVYQPYYLVKYKLPYIDFVKNLQTTQNSNIMVENPKNLHQNLVKHSNLYEISPALKDFDQNAISNMVVSNGTILKAQLVGNNDISQDKFIKEQLDIVRNFNSRFEMKELDDIVNQLNRIYNGKVKENITKLVSSGDYLRQHYRNKDDEEKIGDATSYSVTSETVTENNSNTTEAIEKVESVKTNEALLLKDYYKMIPRMYSKNLNDAKT